MQNNLPSAKPADHSLYASARYRVARRNFWLGSALLILTVLCAFLVLNELTTNSDLALTTAVMKQRSEFLTGTLLWVAFIFKPVFCLLYAAALGLFFLLRRANLALALYLPLSVAVAGVLGTILKKIISRPRPEIAWRLGSDIGFSFPSGHATAISALTLGILFVIFKEKVGALAKICAVILALAVVAAVLFSRLYLAAHWATDIFAGLCLGSGVALLLSFLVFLPADKSKITASGS